MRIVKESDYYYYDDDNDCEQDEDGYETKDPVELKYLAELRAAEATGRVSTPGRSTYECYLEAIEIYNSICDDTKLTRIADDYYDKILEYEEQLLFSESNRQPEKPHFIRECIMFFYRNNHFYMRTPSFAYSADLVPMLEVWLRPQYHAYQTAYLLYAKDAKEIIKEYRHTPGQTSFRSRMENEVIHYAIKSFTRANFLSPHQMKLSFRQIFPTESFESMDEAILSIKKPSKKKVFLRNNKTDHTY